MNNIIILLTILSFMLSSEIYGNPSSDDHLKWVFQTKEEMTQPLIGKDGNLFVGSNHNGHGHIYKITLDGEQLWAIHYPEGFIFKPTSGSNDEIYFVCTNSEVHSIDTNGVEKWKYTDPNGEISRSPMTDANGNIYLISKHNYADAYVITDLVVLNANGTLKWRKNLSRFWMKTKLAIAKDSTIYLALNNKMMAYYPDGSQKWSALVGADVIMDYDSITLDSHDHLYASSLLGTIYRFDTNGTIKSSIPYPNKYDQSPVYFAIDDHDNIYEQYRLSWDTPYLAQISPEGKVNWAVKLSHLSLMDAYAQIVILANKQLFLYDQWSNLMTLDNTGVEQWNFRAPQVNNIKEKPAVDAIGNIYIGTRDGVYALR